MIQKINIFSKYVNPELGGIESTAWYLGKEFEKIVDVYYITKSNNENKDNHNWVQTSGNPLFMALKYIFEVSTGKIKNTKENTYNFCLSYQMALGPFFEKKIKGVKYIVLTHGNEMYTDENLSIKSKLKNYVRRIILNNAEYICTNSNFTRNLTAKATNNKNIIIVSPGVNFVEIVDGEYNPYELFSVGRLIERKGFINTIKAIPLIKKYYPVKYHLAGRGEQEREIVNLIHELNISEDVIFHGPISEEEKEGLFKECELFIMPSKEIRNDHSVEGFGIVYIEANMYGKYVIAANSGGCPDAVINGVTGTIIPNNSPEEIAKGVIDYFKEKRYTFEKEKAKKWAKENSYQSIASRYLSIMNGSYGTKS